MNGHDASPQPAWYPVPIDPVALARYRRVFALSSHDAALTALAKAIAVSPWWKGLSAATIVVRLGRRRAMAVLASFDSLEQARLAMQIANLNDGLRRVIYRDWPSVRHDCRRLARRLATWAGGEDLSKLTFVAIPRGGLFVLAHLAYLLHLKHKQLCAPGRGRGPIVLVDDSAYTGVRIRQSLAQYPSGEVIIAHLYSRPELRRAILAQEPRVRACLAARDFPTRYQQGEVSRQHTGQAHSAQTVDAYRYWRGPTAHVCFPWGEPERLCRVPESGTWESGWRLAPPERSLGNAAVASRRGSGPHVQVQGSPSGRLRPGPAILYAELADGIAVANPARGESYLLAGAAADVWRALLRHGNRAAVVEELGRSYAVDRGTLVRDVSSLVDEMLTRRLLVAGCPTRRPGS